MTDAQNLFWSNEVYGRKKSFKNLRPMVLSRYGGIYIYIYIYNMMRCKVNIFSTIRHGAATHSHGFFWRHFSIVWHATRGM